MADDDPPPAPPHTTARRAAAQNGLDDLLRRLGVQRVDPATVQVDPLRMDDLVDLPPTGKRPR